MGRSMLAVSPLRSVASGAHLVRDRVVEHGEVVVTVDHWSGDRLSRTSYFPLKNSGRT